MRKWSEVAESAGYKALPAAEQDAARRQYFDQVVAPRVPKAEMESAWQQFDRDSRVAKVDLPAGVQPSQAGPGRGEVQPLEPGVSGQIERGNIDLDSRPRVRNADGSTSTIRSISVNLDGREVLIPTISDDGRSLSEAEAIDQYKRTGRHLGVFTDPDAATAYAHRTSEEQGKKLSGASRRNPLRAVQPYGAGGDIDVAAPDPEAGPEGPTLRQRIGEEAGRLRDSFFTGVDQARAGLRMVEGGLLASGVQAKQRNLQDAEAAGDTETAQRLSSQLPGRQQRMGESLAAAAEAQGDAQRGAAMTTTPAMREMLEAQTFGDAWEAFKKAPVEIISGITAQSLPVMLPALLVAATTGPAAGALAMGGSSGAVEAGGALAEFAQESGIDPTDAKALTEFYNDPDVLREGLSRAALRAGIIGAADTVAGGLAGKTLAPAMRSATARQAVNVPTQMGVQAGLGAGGEAGAQIAEAGRIEAPGQVLAEAVGELGGAPAEVLAFRRGAQQQPTQGREEPPQTAEQIARSKGFLATLNDENRRPTAVRQRALSTFQELGSYYGLPENAAKRAGEATASMPADEVPGFLARYAQALQRRGLFSRPLDEEALQAFNPPPEPDTQAQATGVIEKDLEQRLAESLGIAEPEAQPAPAAPAEPTPVDLAAHEAATSPANDRPEPTEAQKDAGNYAKGHIKVGGLDISIENPQGSTRSGTSPDGTAWQNTMASHYGYVRGSTGKDGDHVDVFVKPGTPEDYRGPVYVVDQVNSDGGFDEHKALLGFGSLEEARQGYMANYTPNWQGLGAITEMPLEAFKSWVKDGTKRRPVGDIAKKEAQDVGTPVPAGMVAGGRRDGGSAVDAGGVADPGRAVAQPGGVRPDAGGTVAGPAEGGVVRDGRAADDAALTAKEPQPSDVQDPQNGASAPQAEAKASQAPAAARGDAARAAGPADAGAPAVQADGVSGARILARAGRTPNASTPIELRPNADGTLTPFMEGQAMLDYDSGEPIVLPAGVSDLDAKKAIRAAGAVTNKTNFFPPVQARQQSTDVSAGPGRAPADVESDRLAEVLREQGYDAYVEERAKVAESYGLNANDEISLGNLVESRVGTQAIERGRDQRDPRLRGKKAQARGEPATPPDTLNEAQKVEWLAGWDEGARSDAEQDPAPQPKEAVTLEAEPTKPKAPNQNRKPKPVAEPDDGARLSIVSGAEGYAAKVDGVLDGAIPESASVQVSSALDVLTTLGMRPLPVSTTGDRLAKMHFDHGLTRAELKRLPELLSAPVMVFDSATRPGSFVAVLDLWKNGAPVVAAIEPNYRMDRVDVNLLASAYPKDRAGPVMGKWVSDGLLKYADKSKTRAWATSGGVQFPWLVQLSRGSDSKVLGPADVVKSDRLSLRDDLPVRLPDAIIGQPLSAATKHPDYQAAKAGDVQAAYRLARDLVTPEMVENVRQQVGEGEAVIVPVVAEEAAGRNKIPHAVAAVLGDRLGLAVTADIIQSSQPHRTGMDGLDRLFASPEFDGPVRKGARYALVDDTLTQGGTFAALGSHIQQGGGRVAAVAALTGKQYSAKLALTPETRARLYERFANVEPAFRAATGRGLDTLTESEARYLVTHRSPDAIRARFLAEGRADGSHRASAADLARDLSARGNVQYEAANADDQRIASAAERAFARRRPGFVLRAVEAPGDRPDLRAARALARGVFGHRIIFVQQPAGRIFNGYAFGGPAGDFALIDVDTERPALAVVGHELLHRMRATRPDLYAELLGGLRGVLRGETAYTDALNARRAALGLEPIDQNLGTEELVADVVGDEFMQPEFWEALADAKPSGFQRIAQYVLDFIDSLLKTLRGTRPFGTDQYLSDIEAARAAVVKAMRQFSEGEVGAMTSQSEGISLSVAEARSVTDTPEFRRWFGDSKVVDAAGKPLVMYHGTTASFNEFKGDRNGLIFVTPDPNFAGRFAADSRVDRGGNLMPVYVKARKPFDHQRPADRKRLIDYLLEMHPSYTQGDGQQALVVEGRRTLYTEPVLEATLSEDSESTWLFLEQPSIVEMVERAGFDAMYVVEEGVKNLAVFESAQLKSAIGNRGTFDPNEADIRLSIANPPAPPAAPPTSPPAAAAAAPASAPAPTPIPEESAVRARQRELQDKFNRFTVLREWAKKQGISLTPESDVRAFEERMHGRMATRMEDFREKRVKPLVQKIQAAGFTMEQVAEFLHAQHAEERNLQIEKVSPGNTAGSGMTTADAKKVLAAADPKLAALANEFRSITADTKDILLKAGIVSQEMVDAWDKAYKHYVPLKGGPDDGTQAGTGGGLSVNGRQRRALGHAERDEHIVENILRDHERAIMLAEKNTVGHSLLAFVAELGNDAIATVGHPEKRKVLRDSTSFEVVGRNGAVVGTFDSQAAANRFIVTQDRSGLTIRKVTGDPQVTYMAAPMLAENEVQVYLKGHAVRIQLNDPVLARAYKNLGAEHLNRLMAVNRSVNAFLSKAYTGYNPEFLFVNVLRDLTTGLINITGKYGAGMAADALARYPKAMGSLLRYAFTGKSTPSIDAYRAAGGSTGAAYLGDIERIGADIKASYEEYQGVLVLAGQGRGLAAARVAAKKLLNLLVGWIEKLNQAGENAMRLAVFDAVRNTQGQTVNDAASAAKNVTVNFNRKGEMGPMMGALYLFFNPAIQGTAAMMEALFKSQHKAQAWAMTAGLGAAAYTLAALQFGGDEDDDAWDNIPDHVKERSLIIRTGEKTYLTLPIPYGYGFFYALGNSLFDLQKGRDPDKVALNVASNLVGNFLPMNPIGGDELDARGAVELVPGMFGGELMRAGARVLVNRSGLGGEIVPDSKFDEGKPDSSRMWRTTKGSVYDRLAGGLNAATGGTKTQAGVIDVSPETLKFWVNTVTGGAGKFASDTIGLTWNVAIEGVTPEVNEIPVARKFWRQEDIRDVRSRYWEAVREADEAAKDLSRARRGGDAEGVDQAAQKAALASFAKLAQKQNKLIKARRDMADSILADDSKSLVAKRAIVAEMEARERLHYERLLQAYDMTKEADKRRATERRERAQAEGR